MSPHCKYYSKYTIVCPVWSILDRMAKCFEKYLVVEEEEQRSLS